jgi:FixJ family two-component response regulator
MPGLSGLGLLRAMRVFGRPPATIIMTAFPDSSIEPVALGLGALCVLRKPIDAEKLGSVVRAAVAASSPERFGCGRNAVESFRHTPAGREE